MSRFHFAQLRHDFIGGLKTPVRVFGKESMDQLCQGSGNVRIELLNGCRLLRVDGRQSSDGGITLEGSLPGT